MSMLKKPEVNFLNRSFVSSSNEQSDSGVQLLSSRIRSGATADRANSDGGPDSLTTPTGYHHPGIQPVLPTDFQQPPSNDDGFDDLRAGYGAFPVVRLDGSNVYRIDGEVLGTEFLVNMFKVRPIYLWKDRETVDDSMARLAWSYDNLTTTREENLKEIISVWRAEGYPPIARKYAEVMAEIQDGAWAGKLVVLSVSPQSVGRLHAYRETVQFQKCLRIPEVITRIFVGEPIKTRSITYRPWAFEFLREV